MRASLVDQVGLVDELVVLDDRSTDDTARVAAHAGATVVSIEEIHAEHGTGHGKGNALWATLLAWASRCGNTGPEAVRSIAIFGVLLGGSLFLASSLRPGAALGLGVLLIVGLLGPSLLHQRSP